MSAKAFDFKGTTRANPLKTYLAYDGSSRLEYLYEADPNCPNGGPCLVTRFSYDGATTRIVYIKEYIGTWDTSWEAF